jgi:uncharacterized protein YegL
MGYVINGRFHLRVSVRYVPEPETAAGAGDGEIDFLDELFQVVSQLLNDATDGAHSLGSVVIASGLDAPMVADILILAPSVFVPDFNDVTFGNIWTAGSKIMFPRGHLYVPTRLVHELGHYLYGLFDEYVGSGVGDKKCLGSSSTGACLMEGYRDNVKKRWVVLVGGVETDFMKFGDAANPGFFQAWQNGTAVLTAGGEPSEFCVPTNHPTPSSPMGGLAANYDHYQNELNGDQSCWETMTDPSKGGSVCFHYGLSMPSGSPAGDPPASAPSKTNVVELIPTQRTVLLLDRSSSMTGAKLQQLKDGAAMWVDVVDSPEELGIISFSNATNVDIAVSEVPSDGTLAAWRTAGAAAVDGLVAGGGTAIGDALRAGLNALTAGGSVAGPALVLFTDGHQTAGAETALDVVPDLVAAGVRVFIIGVGNDQDSVLLAAIADGTDGSYTAIPGDLPHELLENMITEMVIMLAA